MGYNGGTYANEFETKSLDHDRDIEFDIDPMDVRKQIKSYQSRIFKKCFESKQAIPEWDC